MQEGWIHNNRGITGGDFEIKYTENNEGEGIKNNMKKFKILTFK